MNIFVDIDNTICTTLNSDYNNSKPIQSNICKINKLYDEGNNIVYWTARGQKSKVDYSEMTKNQLVSWGCKYHEIRMNKPSYDLLIDDKTIDPLQYFVSKEKRVLPFLAIRYRSLKSGGAISHSSILIAVLLY